MLLIHIHVHGEAAAHWTDGRYIAAQAGLCLSTRNSKEKEN